MSQPSGDELSDRRGTSSSNWDIHIKYRRNRICCITDSRQRRGGTILSELAAQHSAPSKFLLRAVKHLWELGFLSVSYKPAELGGNVVIYTAGDDDCVYPHDRIRHTLQSLAQFEWWRLDSALFSPCFMPNPAPGRKKSGRYQIGSSKSALRSGSFFQSNKPIGGLIAGGTRHCGNNPFVAEVALSLRWASIVEIPAGKPIANQFGSD